jgi:hypothetical protein
MLKYKAYDVINHDILLQKLEHYGIRGQINGWLKFYLTLKAQYVAIFSKGNRNSMTRFNSRLRNIKVGIPQGSTSGPLLFLIHINDLLLHIANGEVVLFADDTNILVKEKNKNALQDKMDKVMIQLEVWFSTNNMVINSDKTKAMYFQLVGASHGILPHVANIDNRSAAVLLCKSSLLCTTFP